MKDKPGSNLASQLEVARELLEQGEFRDALVLAMEVLRQELDRLRNTLEVVQESLPQQEETADAGTISSRFTRLKPQSHILH